MEKAIEIKRRAQRSIQSGDLDGALREYQKLVELDDCDPYNFVLLADLLFKRGDKQGALERYLAATSAYDKSGLYKNAIAVCKKMMRLGLSPSQVLERLAELHALDGLGTEASLYYQQFAEHLVRGQRHGEAADALRKAYENTPEEVRLLERLAEVRQLAKDKASAGLAFAEAAFQYQKRGQTEQATACREKAEALKPGAVREFETQYLLSSGQNTEGAPTPPAEDENVTPGPPLLPSLLGEQDGGPGAQGVEGGFERFPTQAGGERGLDFEAPAAGGRAEKKAPILSAAEIEELLHKAQERLHASDQEEASRLLTEAAQAYETVGRHDNAATIYRSLAKSAATPLAVLELWLANCERRDDKREAAQVACELGDRAIQAGDAEGARQWFERAQGLDENNPLAQRRLQRLAEMKDGVGPPRLVESAEQVVAREAERAAPVLGPVEDEPQPELVNRPVEARADAPAAAKAARPAAEPSDRVELAVGRSEAVSFDLGALLSEFQRGIEAQLSGDAQGHYDLAMAYREMGLLDHALESFRMALGNPGLAHRAAEMVGRCLLDQGRFDDAAQELAQALARPGLEADGSLGLRYLLGLAYEAGGQTQEALAQFERVFEQQPNYHDVALKLRNLRKGREAA